MSNPYFSVQIGLDGPDAPSVEDVVGMLRNLADRLDRDPFDQVGTVEDRDGNVVGSYLFDWDGE